MPQVKGLRLPRLKAQPVLVNAPTPVRKHRRQNGYGASVKPVTHYCGYIGATDSLPTVPLSAQRDLWMLRREPPVQDGWVHTPGHKPTTAVVVDPISGVRSRIKVVCHERKDPEDALED